jgi:hypothetical protein
MNDDALITTRNALHAVAELLLAGPAYADVGDIRLRPTGNGFGVWAQPGPRVEGVDLVVGASRQPIVGTIAALAAAAGITPRRLSDVYSDVVDVSTDDALDVDPLAVSVLAAAFADGDSALARFAPEAERVLWPEHFDIGITVDEVNYGVSPGDSYSARPYAYVGPWNRPDGAFWNAPFGAARVLTEFADVVAITDFFEAGRAAAAR